MSNYIFELTRDDYKYKGVLFAELDNSEIAKDWPISLKVPTSFIVGVMGLIWVDEKGKWHTKMRMKFPSGNKQVVSRSYDKNLGNINEAFILQDLYRMPMKYKKWYQNKTEDIEGILKILENSDMIESMQVQTIKKDVDK